MLFLMTIYQRVIVSKLKADTKAMQKSSTNLRLTGLIRLRQQRRISPSVTDAVAVGSEFAVQLGDNTMARARDRREGSRHGARTPWPALPVTRPWLLFCVAA